MINIFYGLNTNIIDVTNICHEELKRNNIITIPASDDNKAKIFGDPLPYVKKKIFILINNSLKQYDDNYTIKINIIDNNIVTISNKDIENKLINIQSTLKLNYGSFDEELPEQKMVVRYLSGNEKVLEIGGNIGRNSLVISSILKDSKNLVTMECDPNIAQQLQTNRDINNKYFYIENSALSKRKLIQQGWLTIVSDELKEGYNWVKTITLDELNSKYNIKFDTLVLDCEGAFYYILIDMPEILDNINLIIMENDYTDISHKKYINNVLIERNFYRDYVEAGGWGVCYNCFFEVWKRDL